MNRRHRIVAALTGLGLAAPVLADRATAWVVEHRLAERLRCAAGLNTDPDVDLRGFPALTQVVAGHLTEIRATAADLPVRGMTVRRVTAVATDVRLSGGVRVGTATVDATVAYAGLGEDFAGRSGMRIVGADDASRLILEGALPVRGVTMPVTVHADLAFADGRLAITPAEVELSSFGLRVPASRLPAAARQTRTVALPALPGGLAYRSVRAAPDGLEVVAHGSALHVPAKNTTRNKDNCGGTA